jgi:hypothetical protein
VSFVPPDGHFKLMNYRVVTKELCSPVYCQSRISYGMGDVNGSMSIMVGLKNQSSWGLRFTGKKVTVEDIVVRIPFPKVINKSWAGHVNTQHNTTQHNTREDKTREDKTRQHHTTTQHNTTHVLLVCLR